MASNELESFHRWALERPEGKKGTTTDETEGERMAMVGWPPGPGWPSVWR
jgi:hypothetical protein